MECIEATGTAISCLDTSQMPWSNCKTLSSIQGFGKYCSTDVAYDESSRAFSRVTCGAVAGEVTLQAVPSSVQATTTSTTSTLIITPPNPPATSTHTPASASVPSHSNHIGAIVGGTIGALFFICAAVLGAFFLRRNRNRSRHHLAVPPGFVDQPEFVRGKFETKTQGSHQLKLVVPRPDASPRPSRSHTISRAFQGKWCPRTGRAKCTSSTC
jgi:hypothetical protein